MNPDLTDKKQKRSRSRIVPGSDHEWLSCRYQIARKLSMQMDSGKQPGKNELARLVQANAQAAQDGKRGKASDEEQADAYAGINAFGAGADRFGAAVNERMSQLYLGKQIAEENGTEEPTGPPSESFSFDTSEISSIQSVGKKSVSQFTSADIQKTEKFAQKYWKELGMKSPFFRAWFGDWRAYDRTPVHIAKQIGNSRGMQKNTDTGWDINVSGKVKNETKSHNASTNRNALPYLSYINDIVRNAVLLDSYSMGNSKSENSLVMHSFYAVADIGHGSEILKLYVEEMNDPNSNETAKRAYQLQNIEKASAASVRVQGVTPSSVTNTANAILNVADLFAAVKRRDAKFKHNPVNPVLLNADGTPKVVYHGTNAEFWEFSSPDGTFWFSENEDYAEEMASVRKGSRVIPAYVRLENPLEVTLQEGEFSDPVHEKPYIRQAKMLGYDGVIFKVVTDSPLVAETFYVAFSPEQVKSADKNVGTFDAGTRDIRYSVDEDGKESGHESFWDKTDQYLTEMRDELAKSNPKHAQTKHVDPRTLSPFELSLQRAREAMARDARGNAESRTEAEPETDDGDWRKDFFTDSAWAEAYEDVAQDTGHTPQADIEPSKSQQQPEDYRESEAKEDIQGLSLPTHYQTVPIYLWS